MGTLYNCAVQNLFEYQDELLSLPVPDLEETGERFLKWIKPLVSQEELKKSEECINEFISENGVGSILQERLEKWDEQTEGSWLKPFWDDMYLEYREPLVLNMNYFIKFNTKELKDKYSMPQLVGKITYEIVKIYKKIANETFEPEKIKGTPLCMEQYKGLLKATRVPQKQKDKLDIGDYNTNQEHIVIFYKENVYKLNVINEEGEFFSPNELACSIEKLISLQVTRGENIGAITTSPRDKAAILLEELKASKVNEENFKTINDAVFAVCIDEESKDKYKTVRKLLASDGRNRFFDKSCQLIVNKNGEIGFNYEHTAVDGSTWVTILGHINKALHEYGIIEKDCTYIPVAEKLEWEISNDIQETLNELTRGHEEKVEKYYAKLIDFEEFGKNEIKNLKVSPDAFFHVALQLAQYRTFGKLRSTYEAVAMRRYNQGRTECARGVNSEVLNFVKEYENNKDDYGVLKELATEAFLAHIGRIKDCQKGHGVERHMFGLFMMYKHFGEEVGIKEMPAIFKDEGYLKLKYDFLSTSGLAAEFVDCIGFGPVVEDGFGVGYSIKNNSISICLTSKIDNKEDAEKFEQNIKESFNDLRKIMNC